MIADPLAPETLAEPVRPKTILPPREGGPIFAIDPGPVMSGFVIWDVTQQRVLDCGVDLSEHVLKLVHDAWHVDALRSLAIEWVESFGMVVGKDVFHTVRWIGRFQQVWPEPDNVRLIGRMAVKRCLCGKANVPAAAVRAALIDRYGDPGTKAAPGILYGVKSHAWSALAIAVTAAETQ